MLVNLFEISLVCALESVTNLCFSLLCPNLSFRPLNLQNKKFWGLGGDGWSRALFGGVRCRFFKFSNTSPCWMKSRVSIDSVWVCKVNKRFAIRWIFVILQNPRRPSNFIFSQFAKNVIEKMQFVQIWSVCHSRYRHNQVQCTYASKFLSIFINVEHQLTKKKNLLKSM